MVRERGALRPLVVTDKGLIDAGVVPPILERMRADGVTPILFSDVLADPPETSVDAAVDFARREGVDAVIGLGGGSSMDTAKLVAVLARGDAKVASIYGTGLAKGPRLPLLQVPTTAGTGSEVTPIAIVTTPDDQKMGVLSSLMFPDAAILDAELTLGLPPRVTAMTGIDAIVHAIEGYTSRNKKNPISDALAMRAISLMFGALGRAVADGKDIAARRDMLLGATLAGMAFANSPVGAVHALAYPLGGLFHVPHGLSNALVLGPVLQFNLEAAQGHYAELSAATHPGETFAEPKAAAAAFVSAIRELVAAMPMEQRLTDVGVQRQDIERLAIDAMKVQRLLVNNPREVAFEDAVALYSQVL
jgi:alcohol dehydrogenase class IV